MCPFHLTWCRATSNCQHFTQRRDYVRQTLPDGSSSKRALEPTESTASSSRKASVPGPTTKIAAARPKLRDINPLPAAVLILNSRTKCHQNAQKDRVSTPFTRACLAQDSRGCIVKIPERRYFRR